MKVRIAAWAISMALPNKVELRRYLSMAFSGIMAAAAGGTLTALAVATLILGSGYWLYGHGYIEQTEAIFYVGGWFVACAFILLMIARHQLQKLLIIACPKVSPSVSPDRLSEIIDGFLEGFLSDPEVRRTRPDSTRRTHKDAA